MRILLVTATGHEIEEILQHAHPVEVLICGVGVPATMYNLTKKLTQHSYDLIVQAGIAGTFSNALPEGEVVLIKQDAFGDIGVEEKGEFKTLFKMGFADANTYPFINEWLVNNHTILHTTKLKVVNAVTVNRVSDRQEQTSQILKIFDAEVESMEGAAFHYTCLQMNIPFLQMRSIANKVGERDKSKWKIKEAIENLNTELLTLIKTLNG